MGSAKNIGAAECHVCGERRADVVEIRRNWIAYINVCDRCAHGLFRLYDKDKSGKAKEE